MRLRFGRNSSSSFFDHHSNRSCGCILGLIVILLTLLEPESWYRAAPETTPTTPTTPTTVPPTKVAAPILSTPSTPPNMYPTKSASTSKSSTKYLKNGIVLFSQPVKCIPKSYR